MHEQIDDELRHAVWQMVQEVDGLAPLAAAYAEVRGWRCYPHQAANNVSKQLAPESRHPMHAGLAEVAKRVLVPMGARDRVTPIQQRESIAATCARDTDPDIVEQRERDLRRMATVRRERKGRGVA